jgi:hypothetical protein
VPRERPAIAVRETQTGFQARIPQRFDESSQAKRILRTRLVSNHGDPSSIPVLAIQRLAVGSSTLGSSLSCLRPSNDFPGSLLPLDGQLLKRVARWLGKPLRIHVNLLIQSHRLEREERQALSVVLQH